MYGTGQENCIPRIPLKAGMLLGIKKRAANKAEYLARITISEGRANSWVNGEG